MEWTAKIISRNRNVLKRAEIYDAVAVAQYPFSHNCNVWRAFAKLWGPTSNTLHHIGGEMRISLYDLKTIGEYFYRGEQMFVGLKTKQAQDSHSKDFQKKPQKSQLRQLPLQVSEVGMLFAFLSLWLSRFVLPTKGGNIRPETFYMASLMAQGTRVSLAPIVLGYIYRTFNEYVAGTNEFGVSRVFLPMHYVIGWLAEHVPYLYFGWEDNNNLPLLRKYARIELEKRTMTGSRHMIRDEQHVRYRPYSYHEERDTDYLDDEDLADEKFELLLSMRAALLPVRVGGVIFVELYYPNRFARQFRFDQGVPSDKFRFTVDAK
ncbi:uncharacterized protein LOC112093356 [Morus notabilis]|uniref:uncharacterized protein LOC112093356 n=1 Tax=Morus notabilis TaxID=981085 RepID=UPI000CED75F9|nr:uncharacterized protein LOC112093356 [Morus notabilis]